MVMFQPAMFLYRRVSGTLEKLPPTYWRKIYSSSKPGPQMNHLPKKLIGLYMESLQRPTSIPSPFYSNQGQILSFQAWWRWRNDTIPNLGNHKIHVVTWVGRRDGIHLPTFLYGCTDSEHCVYNFVSINIYIYYLFMYWYIFKYFITMKKMTIV